MTGSGEEAEARAVNMLRAAKLQIVARNFRCRRGEIDIVALDHGHLVFIEVRLRSHPRYAGAAASVDRRKQRRLILAAEYFRLRHPRWRDYPCRFDVIAFEPRQSAPGSGAQWIRAAFMT
jgi:putative endonuclease